VWEDSGCVVNNNHINQDLRLEIIVPGRVIRPKSVIHSPDVAYRVPEPSVVVLCASQGLKHKGLPFGLHKQQQGLGFFSFFVPQAHRSPPRAPITECFVRFVETQSTETIWK